jgi:hypothetical protein
MKTGLDKDLELRSSNEGVSFAGSTLLASKPRIPRSPATRLLRIQQPPADHVQIGERGLTEFAVAILILPCFLHKSAYLVV